MNKSVDNDKSNKIRKILDTFLSVFLTVTSVVALAVSCVLIYQKRYLTPFWVNGQSMYPTLNADALEPNGTKSGFDGGDTQNGSTLVDYGVMDCHKKALSKLERFDIIVTKYSETDSSKKIKRIIGLPGETIKLTNTGSGNAHNGDLNVLVDGEYKVIDQPIDNEIIQAGVYSGNEIKLGVNEYYVLGDNRYPGKSTDSRALSENIKLDYIIGKVIAICGTCEIEEGEVKNVTYHKPRYFK